jgi:solute carrier family 25 aspartate/glutamate transporter 12/13
LKSLYAGQPIDEAESNVEGEKDTGSKMMKLRRNNLVAEHFAYVDFVAFQDVLLQLPAICSLVERACEIKKGSISPDDLKVANRVLGIGGQLSRQQVDIIFRLLDLDQDGYISFDDAVKVCGVSVGSKMLDPVEGRDGKQTFAPPPNYPKTDGSSSLALKQRETSSNDATWSRYFKHFVFSCIAGGMSVLTVYPFDLVKTRMMNQRTVAGSGSARMYATSFDCLRKVFKYEGIQGLYRGIYPPLLAVGPEMFIKATVNRLVLSALSRDLTPDYALQAEMVSGACAGACQLLVTNPLEIAKIRMQVQGETTRLFKEKGFSVPKGLGLSYASFTDAMKELGVSGLYKGASACLLRDIQFGAIYFPAYTECRKLFAAKDYVELNSFMSAPLLCGTLAAIPASVVTSPVDFLKTRLQVAPRPGEDAYTGLFDCIYKVYEREGPSAFFKGLVPRVCRLAPQCGISMFLYEKLMEAKI